MTLTYEDALVTLQSMFGEPWTLDALDAVLRYQKGHMENTVDFILRYKGRDPQLLAAGIFPDDLIVALDAELARQISLQPTTGRNSFTPAPRAQRGIPTVLPDDFLRVPGQTQTTHALSVVERDEILALTLQTALYAGGESDLRTHHRTRGLAPSSLPLAYPAMSRRLQSEVHQQQAERAIPVVPGIPVVSVMSTISESGDGARKQVQVDPPTINTGGRLLASPTAPDGIPVCIGLSDDKDHAVEFATCKTI